ncbi:nitroreductase family protein [Tumebacillus lipolyticus]|uniref:Nitroreductase family protein n=1 Tax=Tumebacillus lipolyticus TaxID=1280370 RepID=A0ABW4ZVB6_9BACL
MEVKTDQMVRETAVQLFEAIEHRHSMRSYTGEPLPAPEREKLIEFLQKGWEPYPGARTRAVLLEGVETTKRIFKGFLGSYGSVQNAPAMICMIGNVEDPFFYEATGYMGEQCVLYATRLGFDTCWVGGFFRPELAGDLIGLERGERVLAVSPVGFAKKDGMSSLYEGLFKFGTKRGVRKSIEQISYVEDVTPPNWFYRGLEAVQVAPSSMNKQPWHIFYHQDGRISISSVETYRDKKPIVPGAPNSSRLCCGIAMLHLKVATRALGIEGRWIPDEEQSNPIATYFIPDHVREEQE